MTEFSVGDRVLVPGVVVDVDASGVEVDLPPMGHGSWFRLDDLRPDTGGRDLTAQDVESALGNYLEDLAYLHVADRLNRIARGDAGSAGDDTALPYCALCGCDHQHKHDDADVIDGSRGCIQCRWCSGEFPNAGPWAEANAPDDEDRAIQPIDWARREVLFLAREVCEYRGSEIGGKKLDQLAVAFTTLDEKVAEKRAAAAARRVEFAAAGPRAGDTAPLDGPSCPDHGPGEHVTGQAFGAGREWFCTLCDDTFLWVRPATAAAPVSDTSSTLRHLAGELRDGPPAWLPAVADSSWRTEVAAWLEHHADQHSVGAIPARSAGYTLDDQGRRVADGWDHDGDLIATFQGDLNRQRKAGDRLAEAAKQVRMVNGAPVGLDALADAVDAWEENR